MKKFKKVFVAVLTFILSVCMIGSVSAETATPKKGSITITGTTKEKGGTGLSDKNVKRYEGTCINEKIE